MRYGTTVLLILLAAALAVGIVVLERTVPSTKEAEQMQARPLVFDLKAVDRIEIKARESKVTLAVKDGAWCVQEPLEDRADVELVSRLLADLRDVEWVEQVARDELSDSAWKKTDLSSPMVSARLLGGGALLGEVSFGSPAALEGTVYATASNGVRQSHHVARTAAAQALQKPAEEWRDSKLARFQVERVTRLVIAGSGGLVEAVRERPDRPWMLVKPLQTRGHEEHINEVLATLANLEVTAVAEARSSAASSGAAAGDDIEVTLELAGAREALKVKLRKPVDGQAGAEATVSHRDAIFTVTSDTLPSLWARPNDLRDDRLARFDTKTVKALTITSLVHPPVQLQKQNDSWFLQRHGKIEAANGERAAILLEALTTHRIREFAADSASNLAAYGLDRPFLTIAWTTADDKTARLLFGTDGKEGVFAKQESEPFVYRVAAAVLAAFPTDGVKWKGLNPVRFSLLTLRRISLSAGTAPPVTLDYNPANAQWSGSLAGKDITAMIDRRKADNLAASLAKLPVQDWAQDRADALKALATPAITVRLDFADPGNPEATFPPKTIRFAPTQPGEQTFIYYGQVDDGPDVFFITREKLLEVIASVFKSPAQQ